MTRLLGAVALRALPAIAGTGLLLLGAASLLVPGRFMGQVGLESIEALGLNFMRGDVAASLIVIGALAWRAARLGDGRLLDIPLIWAALVIAGRTLGLFADPDGMAQVRALVPGLILAALMLPPRMWLRPAARD